MQCRPAYLTSTRASFSQEPDPAIGDMSQSNVGKQFMLTQITVDGRPL
jgi:hypothetical protein